ncbi:DUF3810 family protein [Winogradskyella sp. 3972H.M.0a.05]|uniref:DUF3810 domain-containing protein n=1 Tax=Winogradskyella sp. 3972H.M.0a.05 TaxID=2950277 RepID=UPI003391CF22
MKPKSIIVLALPIQIIVIKLLSYFPEFVEQVYSNGIYKFIALLMHYAFGWLPFSFGDIFYTIIILLALKWLVKNRKRIIKDTRSWIVDVLAAVSIAYFAFHILWAFNYYRLPLHESLEIGHEYSTEELLEVTHQLIAKTNEAHAVLSTNDTLKIEFPYTKNELIDMVPDGYDELSKKYEHFKYPKRSIKKSIYSLQLTYMGFSGYLNPFTNEAQIDGLLPKFKYPTTASHEVAHQLGYAAENEANFIGSMASIHHPDAYFQYSGYAFILRHCLGEVYKREPKLYESIVDTLNIGVVRNYQEVRAFWNSYENPLEPLFRNTYSGFLKANNQSGGIESYSYVVALYVNYFKEYPFEK